MALLKPRENGAVVRMYRPGHGDCFLLAFPRAGGPDASDRPYYVLIDCGYKPGSQSKKREIGMHGKPIGDVVAHIGEATGKHIDLFVVTHEHQDHVNGIWKKNDPYFGDFTVEEAWLAWTEHPTDPLAEKLRTKHRDQLLSLVEARHQLALAVGEDDPTVGRLDSLLSLEFGGEEEDQLFDLDAMRAAASSSDPSKSSNKQAMKLVKDKAAERRGVRFLSPGGAPIPLEGSAGVRAYVLGPPRDADLLKDEDPGEDEGFPSLGVRGLSFSRAVRTTDDGCPAPFSEQFCVPRSKALRRVFFRDHYGRGDKGHDDRDQAESPDNAPWRRIDAEWLFAADSLALKLNRGINNTSLVLAFELPGSKKVLLFVGDAQRGNWVSWNDQVWEDGDEAVTCRDLLRRTVLYKVGHHGSHNATLAGDEDADEPNLSWMGRDRFGDEFTAMITAVNNWATKKNTPPWRHPLPSIKEALLRKAQGRVFQTDTGTLDKPEGVPQGVWDDFLARAAFEPLYFDYHIPDGQAACDDEVDG